jgi:dienelactone hydrolase
MSYDPFARGTFAVVTGSGEVVDRARGGRRLPYELWRPGTGSDLRPLVVYSHASYGHRRQASFFLTHLASHGYVAAALDHVGNTAADLAARAGASPRSPEELDAYVAQIIDDRVPDVVALMDTILSGAVNLIDPARIATVGWSFGGWAALATPERDARVRAVMAMSPAGSARPLPGIIPARLTFAWRAPAETLVLAAERDRFTPLEGIRELFSRAPEPKRLFVLRGADHEHFADDVGPSGPSPEQAHAFTRSLGLAHLDAALRGDPAARTWIEHDATRALRQRGIGADEEGRARIGSVRMRRS